jgi:hypothetical protein
MRTLMFILVVCFWFAGASFQVSTLTLAETGGEYFIPLSLLASGLCYMLGGALIALIFS